MPFVGWYDSARGMIRPFGTEWEWEDAPIGHALLADIAERIVADRAHDFERLTPTTLLSSPRQVVMERYMDCALDPEEAAAMHYGATIHEMLTKQALRAGYVNESLTGTMFGVQLVGTPDGYMPPGTPLLVRAKDADDARVALKGNAGVIPLERPEQLVPFQRGARVDILEFKFTTSGSLRFVLEDGPKVEHVAQVNMYRAMYAQTWGVDPTKVTARLEYYAMPQKERTSLGWVRMPPGAAFNVPYMSEFEIGELRPGYSEPKKASDYQGPPPTTVKENARILTAAFGALKEGVPVETVIKRLECQCERRFNGKGKDYCNVRRHCNMLDHGTPLS